MKLFLWEAIGMEYSLCR